MVLKCSQNKLKYHFRKIIKLGKQKFIQHNLKCIFLLQQLGGFFTCTDVYFKKIPDKRQERAAASVQTQIPPLQMEILQFVV